MMVLVYHHILVYTLLWSCKVMCILNVDDDVDLEGMGLNNLYAVSWKDPSFMNISRSLGKTLIILQHLQAQYMYNFFVYYCHYYNYIYI